MDYKLLFGFVVALAGCAIDDADVDTDTDSIHQEAGCSPVVCGTNNPQLFVAWGGTGVPFYELNEQGEPNPQGIKLLGIRFNKTMYSVNVARGRLTATKSGRPTLSGVSLVGGSLVLQYGERETLLQIVEVGLTTFFDGGPAETYKIVQQKDLAGVDVEVNVCSVPSSIDGVSPGMDGSHMVLFEGERIDPTTKTISSTIDPNWFTLGCAGHLLSKVFLTRHAWASLSTNYAPTLAQRQTMVRFYSADYCGTGRSFTIGGLVTVGFRDDMGGHPNWSPLDPSRLRLEADWGPNGAICLEYPRDAGIDVESAILSECARPPSCSSLYGNADINAFNGAHIVSAAPI